MMSIACWGRETKRFLPLYSTDIFYRFLQLFHRMWGEGATALLPFAKGTIPMPSPLSEGSLADGLISSNGGCALPASFPGCWLVQAHHFQMLPAFSALCFSYHTLSSHITTLQAARQPFGAHHFQVLPASYRRAHLCPSSVSSAWFLHIWGIPGERQSERQAPICPKMEVHQ